MQVRCFFLVVFEAIFKDKPYVLPKLLIGFVNIEIDLIHDGAQIHGIVNNLKIIWTTIFRRIHRLAEEHTVVNIVLGEVEQLRRDEHQTLTPLPLYLVGLNDG